MANLTYSAVAFEQPLLEKKVTKDKVTDIRVKIIQCITLLKVWNKNWARNKFWHFQHANPKVNITMLYISIPQIYYLIYGSCRSEVCPMKLGLMTSDSKGFLSSQIYYSSHFLYSVLLQPNSWLSSSFLRFLEHTHLDTHTNPVGLLWRSDQHTVHNKHNRRKTIPSPGFETAIPANKRFQIYALDGRATGISCVNI
jgi:hypothetical protein